jgi:hypothetical protein
MRGLGAAGLIAIAFGMGSYYATDHFGLFSGVNALLGGLAGALATAHALSRLRGASAPPFRGILLRGLLGIAAALLLAAALERAAHRSGVQFDWSFEKKFALSEATLAALADLPCPLTATLYYEDFDPRRRSSRLLLRTMAQTGTLSFDERRLDDHPDEEDRYAIDPPTPSCFVRGSVPDRRTSHRGPSTRPLPFPSRAGRSTSLEEPAKEISSAPMRWDSPGSRRRSRPRAIACASW